MVCLKLCLFEQQGPNGLLGRTNESKESHFCKLILQVISVPHKLWNKLFHLRLKSMHQVLAPDAKVSRSQLRNCFDFERYEAPFATKGVVLALWSTHHLFIGSPSGLIWILPMKSYPISNHDHIGQIQWSSVASKFLMDCQITSVGFDLK